MTIKKMAFEQAGALVGPGRAFGPRGLGLVFSDAGGPTGVRFLSPAFVSQDRRLADRRAD